MRCPCAGQEGSLGHASRRHQSDALAAEAHLEILVLLLGERLERCRVHDAAAARQPKVDGELPWEAKGWDEVRQGCDLSRAALYLSGG